MLFGLEKIYAGSRGRRNAITAAQYLNGGQKEAQAI